MLEKCRMKNYEGRLAFDPDNCLHTDSTGKHVVTDDEGKTWRYAVTTDVSHYDRYHQRAVVVDSTANQITALSLEHGRSKAAKLVDKHHFAVQSDDPHFEEVRSIPNAVAATITGHTEAHK